MPDNGRSVDDPWDSPEWLDFARRVRDDMTPKLADSLISLSLAPDGDGDVKYWVELGASIMLDKPIIVIASPGQPVPPRLLRVADAVIRADVTTPAGRAHLERALPEIVERYAGGDDVR